MCIMCGTEKVWYTQYALMQSAEFAIKYHITKKEKIPGNKSFTKK